MDLPGLLRRPDGPWEPTAGDPGPAAVIRAVRKHHADVDVDTIERAWRVAARAHDGQMRQSGEPYITHPLAVAEIVANLGLDVDTVIAAILHDTVEDTPITLAQLRRLFGPDVAALVDGVTKLDAAKLASREHAKVATLKKLLVALSDDVRVLLLKLCDRLHNLQTIFHDGISEEKRLRVGAETMEVFVPLAARLGVWELKSQLEDLAFRATEPEAWRQTQLAMVRTSPQSHRTLAVFADAVRRLLLGAGIDAQVVGRTKSLRSAYLKALSRGVEVEELHDLLGVRIIVDEPAELYRALGIVNGGGTDTLRWAHIPGTLDDYVANPKHNSYQSLHTTVVVTSATDPTLRGQVIEAQIRTLSMHQKAENGIASHFQYKAAREAPEWLSDLTDRAADTAEPADFLAALKTDLVRDELWVFTRDGEPMRLPTGATPLDVAYRIHTAIGNRCVGARINGRTRPLRTALRQGDRVEIITDDDAPGPRPEWIDAVVTPRARAEISRQVKLRRRRTDLDQGRRELRLAVGEQGLDEALLDHDTLASVCQPCGYPDVDSLLAAVGTGDLPAGKVVAAALADRGDDRRVVTLHCIDRVGLLADAARLCADLGVPITAASTHSADDGTARLALTLAAHPNRADAVAALRSVDGVTGLE